MADITACLSTGKDDWETPDALFQRYNADYGFDLDAAANEVNHKCDLWFGPGGIVEDSLAVDWLDYTAGPVWLNPPYSRGLQAKFMEKAASYAGELLTVCLLPSRTDTKLFHDFIYENTHAEVTFLKGRVRFKGAAASAPFPSMIVVFS
jgi:site-specific DNA-methyltransferase (adenine-specific)